MKSNGILIVFLTGTTFLSACGSSGPSVASRAGNAPADRVMTKDAGNAAQALQDGETLSASQRASAGIKRDYDAETGELLADSTARVTRNDAGGVDLEVDGQTISFSPADLTADGGGFEKADGSGGIWAWSGDSMADQLDPAKGRNSLVFDYYAEGEGNTGRSGFVVVGTETDAGDLAALPTATYEGWAQVRAAPKEGFDEWDKDVTEARGDLAMTADFGAGKVSGGVTNMEGRASRADDPTRTWTPFDGSLTLHEAAITDNGFTGAVSGDSAFTSEVGTIADGSSYSGTFFGSNADEVAGGINLTGTSADGAVPYLGWGVWQAWKQ